MLPTKLNLGCGRKRLDKFLNVDISPFVEPDLVWDLERRPFPLPESYFDEIRAYDVVEHLHDIPGLMGEAYRLLVPGGTLEITTPHFSCANSYTDPTHRYHLGYFSFDCFSSGHDLEHYAQCNFQITRRKLYFEQSSVSRLLFHFANRYPRGYERHLAWMLPAWFIGIQLRAVK